MPLRLMWYILRDLLKLLALSTLVILTLLAFGVAIKPLSDGVLSPFQLARFIGLSLPAMLQFALPFSAALSATLVYHRMTSDNEMTACAAAGVSHSMMLAPAVLLGGVLTIILLVVANYVSPYFWAAMDRAVRVDAADFLVTSIQKGEPVVADDTIIDARRIGRFENPSGQVDKDALWMEEVIVLSVSKGHPEWDATARHATLELSREGAFTYVDAWLGDAVVYDADSRSLWWQDEFYRGNIAVPEAFKDTPKFMDRRRMKAVLADPQSYWRVAQRVAELRNWIVRRALRDEIERQIRTAGRVEFVSKRRRTAKDSSVRRYVLMTSGLTGEFNSVWKALMPTDANGGDCRILVYEGGSVVREYSAPSVTIEPNPIRGGSEPTVELASTDTVSRDVSTPGAPVTQRSEIQLSGLTLNVQVAAPIQAMSLAELRKRGSSLNDPETFEKLSHAVDREVLRMRAEILSRQNDRAALSVSCLIMMMLGSSLALFMRSALPLTVYFCSFVPAILGLVVISAGVDMMKNPDLPTTWGVMLLWSGNAAMSLLAMVVLTRVMRH